MQVQAAVLKGPRLPFELIHAELDETLLPHEVLVKVVATGLCHTDLTVRDEQLPSPFPVILGHEGAGVVAAIGSEVKSVKVGDHVVLAPSHCGHCSQCRSGHPSYCRDFLPLNIPSPREDGTFPFHQDGQPLHSFFFGQSSFSSMAVTTENNLVPVSKELPLELLGPLGCGLQTGAGTVLNVLRPSAGSSIAVFGVGPVGMAAIMAARASGCTTIVAVDMHENRLSLAKELGATNILIANDPDLKKHFYDIAPQGVQFSVDTTGKNAVVNTAVSVLQPRGRCALVAVPSSPELTVNNQLFTAGRSIEYVVEGDSIPQLFIPQLIDLYQRGMFPFDRLVKFYEFGDFNQAVADSEKGVTLKAIIRMPK